MRGHRDDGEFAPDKPFDYPIGEVSFLVNLANHEVNCARTEELSKSFL